MERWSLACLLVLTPYAAPAAPVPCLGLAMLAESPGATADPLAVSASPAGSTPGPAQAPAAAPGIQCQGEDPATPTPGPQAASLAAAAAACGAPAAPCVSASDLLATAVPASAGPADPLSGVPLDRAATEAIREVIATVRP